MLRRPARCYRPRRHREAPVMTTTHTTQRKAPTIARLETSEKISFGPLSHYQALINGDGGPVFTGVQTCEPGYQTALHHHPYVECLFIIQGTMHAWMEGGQDSPVELRPGDMISLPAGEAHAFRNPGPGVLRLL